MEARTRRWSAYRAPRPTSRVSTGFPRCRQASPRIDAKLTGFRSARAENVTVELGQILKVDLSMGVGGVFGERGREGRVTAHRRQAERVGGEHPGKMSSIESPKAATSRISSPSRHRVRTTRAAAACRSTVRADPKTASSLTASTPRRCGPGCRRNRPDRLIQEVQVRSSGYNAEYRASTGGVISAIAKTGGNQYHGSFGTLSTATTCARRPPADAAAEPDQPDDCGIHHCTARRLHHVGTAVRCRRTNFQGQGVILCWISHSSSTPYERSRSIRTARRRRSCRTPRITTSTTLTSAPAHEGIMRGRFAVSNERTKGAPSFPSIEPDRTSRDNPASSGRAPVPPTTSPTGPPRSSTG